MPKIKTNILYITNWFPTEDNPIAGIFIKNHIECISNENINKKLLFIHFSKNSSLFSKKITEYTLGSISVVDIHIQSFQHKFLYYLFPLINNIIYHTYKKQIEPEFKADFIHSNVVFPAGIWGYFLAKKLHIPHILSEHWSGTYKFVSKNPFGYLGKAVYNNAAAITAVSPFLKNEIVRAVGDAISKKIEIIPNVVQKGFSEVKKSVSTENTFTFIAIARWVKPKRPDLLIETLVKIAEKYTEKQFVLYIVGDGILIEPYRNYPLPHNLKLEFCGSLNREQLIAQVAKSTYFLHASDVETFSIVTAEALMAGLPSVVSRRGALPDLVNTEKYGFLAENTQSEWFSSIEKLINTTFDTEYIRENNKNRFTDTYISAKFESIYKSLT